jgi:hypothetical protein
MQRISTSDGVEAALNASVAASPRPRAGAVTVHLVVADRKSEVMLTSTPIQEARVLFRILNSLAT